ncbi:hypothetical protein PUMCH_000408 [Australozyma saopauloensis]|uniref:Proline dehydrogenase n=1 Tax=Australozyma saopauloensis TaxID=291208 RepID=A0AAX4H3T5_9ASCO|nr:hypothetical protein PUMCH_000408 [[Candida] saopauloensis]
MLSVRLIPLAPLLKANLKQSLQASSRLGPITFSRQFNISTKKRNSYIANNAGPATLAPMNDATKFDSTFLKQFKTSELVSFMLIGICTLNKPILNLCIKLFPYVPMPVIKALVYKIYCGGETIEEVKTTGERLTERGINNMMISLTIEACNGNDNIDPQYIVSETQKSVEEILIPHTLSIIENSGKSINSIPAGYVALKPTGFTKNAAAVLKNFDSPEYKDSFDELVANASAICKTIFDANKNLAKQYPERTAPFVVGVIDAEKYDLQPGVYELQRRLYKQFNPVNSPVSVVGTLQMYLSGSADLLTKEEQLAKDQNYRVGMKLVRGAYIHSEKDRANVIHKTKTDTDNNYNSGITYCIKSILDDQLNKSPIGHLVVASHNADSLKLATDLVNKSSPENSSRANVCLGQLLGMADSITYDLIKKDNVENVIKYVPWGPPLETKEYLLRRLEENGDAVKNDNGLPLVKAAFTTLMSRIFA